MSRLIPLLRSTRKVLLDDIRRRNRYFADRPGCTPVRVAVASVPEALGRKSLSPSGVGREMFLELSKTQRSGLSPLETGLALSSPSRQNIPMAKTGLGRRWHAGRAESGDANPCARGFESETAFTRIVALLRPWSWLSIFCATLIAYWPALHGQFLCEDSVHVTRPEGQFLQGLWRIWSQLAATPQYCPVLHSAFWVEHQLWGDSVLGYHLV